MRRPMPPDLIALGDQLEAAAARALGRRRARRQSLLNSVASFLIAVPFALAIISADLPRSTPLETFSDATPASVLPARTGYRSDASHIPSDARIAYLRNGRTPELLILPTTLRPALR
jgi:hypothetical protein